MKKNSTKMDQPSELLIFNKNYNINSDFGSLIPPSDEFFEICKFHVSIFTNFFQKHAETKNIAEKIENICIDATMNIEKFSLWFAESDCFHHQKMALRFMIEVLLFKNCKWINNKSALTTKENKLKIFKQSKSKSLTPAEMNNF